MFCALYILGFYKPCLSIASIKIKVKLSLCFKWAPHYDGTLGEWRYSSTHSWPWQKMEMSGQLHMPATF